MRGECPCQEAIPLVPEEENKLAYEAKHGTRFVVIWKHLILADVGAETAPR